MSRERGAKGWTRRRIVAAGGSLLAGGALAACELPGRSTPPAQSERDVTISYVTDWGSGARGEFVKQAVLKFQEEHPRIKVQVDNWAGEVGVVALANAAAGTLQDTMLNSNDVFIQLARNGGMQDITPALRSLRVNMNDLVHLPSTYSYQGKQYGMPFQVIVQMMMLNKTLFQRHNAPLPDAKTTFPQFLDALRLIARPNDNQWAYITSGSAGNWGWWLPYVWGYGGERWTPDLKRSLIAEPGSIEGLQFYVDLMYRYQVATPLNDNGGLIPQGVSFVNGNLAVNHGSAPGADLHRQIAGRFDWDVMYIPIGPRTNKRHVFTNNQANIVTSGAVNRRVFDQAVRFVVWLSASKTANDLMIEIGPGSYPPLKAALNGTKFLSGPPASLKIVSEMIPDYKEPMTFIGWNKWRDDVVAALRPAFANKKPVRDAAADAARAGDLVLASIPR